MNIIKMILCKKKREIFLNSLSTEINENNKENNNDNNDNLNMIINVSIILILYFGSEFFKASSFTNSNLIELKIYFIFQNVNDLLTTKITEILFTSHLVKP